MADSPIKRQSAKVGKSCIVEKIIRSSVLARKGNRVLTPSRPFSKRALRAKFKTGGKKKKTGFFFVLKRNLAPSVGIFSHVVRHPLNLHPYTLLALIPSLTRSLLLPFSLPPLVSRTEKA